MFIKFKKTIAVILTVSLILLYTVPVAPSFAQTATDTPSPTPSDSPTPTPVPSSDTALLTTSPSPSPSSVPSPSPTEAVNASNSATVSNNISSTAISGDNTISATSSADIATSSASQDQGALPASGGSSVNTGNSVSAVNTTNNVNSNSVNSKVVNQTINLFIAQNGNLSLNDPFVIVTDAVQTHPNEPVVNVSVTNVNNFAYLANDIISYANSGQNSVSGAESSAVINTGNAYSLVSLLNQVNFTVVNSQVHVITINIFGKLNGNIVLPNINSSTSCTGCGVNLNTNNNANVSNNVDSTAISGQNSIVATESAGITTGVAKSVVSNINIVNSNYYGTNVRVLYINDFGNWNGNFVGWGSSGPREGGASLVFYSLGPNNGTGEDGCLNCAVGALNSTSSATVLNNITSLANSGGNNINGGGLILTGNSYSAVSVINFINSNFINSIGFFGFINIFGSWTGDIGGQSNFDALNTNNNNQDNNANNQPQIASSSQNSNSVQENGGLLSVSQYNNTGPFVYPGDTVTFFAKTKNPGTGKVYGAKLMLFLLYNGKNAGGGIFNIGDIPAEKQVNFNTGLVLSKHANPGKYIARVFVYGKTGPNDTVVSATADSNFTVFGGAIINRNIEKPNKEVLGTHYPLAVKGSDKNDYGPLYALISVIVAYIALRGIRERDKFMTIFEKRITLEERMKALRIFLI